MLELLCACETRRDAERRGEMYLAVALGGWVFPYDYGTAAWNRERVARPYVWTFCPFCGRLLPLAPFPKQLPPSPADDTDDCA